ncbi:uncharacterized protein LOC124439435 [Xenia sp. Carnegie-2017]|uniref:uncharacterized protein LOC124439435 n=1 Tax=Xenia sp. Carnegie-2017 TaxID=2897299 RepID=UPI001F046A1A|nr:uncharacterized protein LOC124439435 [Xenia sp. Carnegie-2017]
MPKTVSKITYQELCDVDFTSSKRKKQKLDEHINELASSSSSTTDQTMTTDKPRLQNKYKPSENQIKKFYQHLSDTKSNPAILSLISPFNEKFVPKRPAVNLHDPLNKLYSHQFACHEYEELISKSKEVMETIKINQQQADMIEKATRNQSKSQIWHQMRMGRITASNFHRACRTNPETPSLSLVKDVCYGSQFKSDATSWGKANEKRALNQYTQVMKENHSIFSVKESGFVIDPKYPFLGASPDAISYCNCHGEGCVEIKCPYSLRNKTIQHGISDGKNFCLTKTPNGTLQMDRKHQYYYQVQLQLASTKLKFVDFVVWTLNDIYIEQIQRDDEFLAVNIEKAKEIYIFAILPELLAKFHTSKPLPSNDTLLFCYCRVTVEPCL